MIFPSEYDQEEKSAAAAAFHIGRKISAAGCKLQFLICYKDGMNLFFDLL
jgi:hypothetical protein